MALTYKFFINFHIGSVKISLSTELNQRDTPDHVKNKYFSGHTSNLNLPITRLLQDLLHKIPGDIPTIPEGLLPELIVEKVYASYNGKTKEACIVVPAKLSNREVRFFFSKSASHYAFGLLSDINGFEKLPMVGKQMKDVGLADVGFIYSSAPGHLNLPRIVDDAILDHSDIKNANKEEVQKMYARGFNLGGALNIPVYKEPLSLVLPVSSSAPIVKGKEKKSKKIIPLPSGSNPVDPAGKWFKFDKKIGPLHTKAVGLNYKKDKLSLLFRGDISLAGIILSLEGLGISFKLSHLLKGDLEVPDFNLNGLGITYNKPPVEISGAFLRTTSDVGTLEFSGAAVLKAASFTITGLGSYTKLPSGDSSLFIYALFDKPLGGPAFFYITGVAAGFGYNRKVRIPKTEEMKKFPLVSLALKPDPGKTLSGVVADLTHSPQWIPPSLGDYWLAVGVKFSSFKIVESFILLIVELGHRVVFNVLGLSVLKWPEKGTTIAHIELALQASFGPDSDVIAINADITPPSYIMDKHAQLTGGFAFYSWVSGEHEGDFVLTLGGYNSHFKKPGHYPSVKPLTLNWKLPHYPVTVKGKMYFALTPTAIMAGGRWEVTYDIGFLRAYIILKADMLILWAPFHYFIEASIRVGIQARIKILFVHINFSLEMGATLSIWGPPFAGEVYVDWSIFSFTIPFGADAKNENSKLEWDAFRKSFLPHEGAQTKPVSITITDGIIDEHKDKNGKVLYTIVNPHKLKINIDSAIPLQSIEEKRGTSAMAEVTGDTTMKLAGNTNQEITYQERQMDLGIRPMERVKLGSTLKVTALMGSGAINMHLWCHGKSVPEALWSPTKSSSSNKNPGASAVIKNALSGVGLSPVHEEIPKGTPQFDLDGKYNEVGRELRWIYSPAINGPSNESFTNTIKEVIVESLNDTIIQKTKFEILSEVAHLENMVDEDIHFEIDNNWVDHLTGNPVIVPIGGMPQYTKEKGKAV